MCQIHTLWKTENDSKFTTGVDLRHRLTFEICALTDLTDLVYGVQNTEFEYIEY